MGTKLGGEVFHLHVINATDTALEASCFVQSKNHRTVEKEDLCVLSHEDNWLEKGGSHSSLTTHRIPPVVN